MKINYVVAEFNFADDRWATALFNLNDKVRDIKNSKTFRNIRNAISVNRHRVIDENGVIYLRFSDNSLLAG